MHEADCCIFCGAKDNFRTDEHVIPLAWNGRTVIGNATCSTCQIVLNRELEGPISGHTYKPLRISRSFQSRGPRRNRRLGKATETDWPAVLRFYDEETEYYQFSKEIRIPKVEGLVPLVYPSYNMPGFLYPGSNFCMHGEVLKQENKAFCREFWTSTFDRFRIAGLITEAQVSSPGIVPDNMDRLITKIAVGFFFLSRRTSLEQSTLQSDTILSLEKRGRGIDYIFSCHTSFLGFKNRGTVFDVCEDGVLYSYCCIDLFGGAHTNRFLVRIPCAENLTSAPSFFD